MRKAQPAKSGKKAKAQSPIAKKPTGPKKDVKAPGKTPARGPGMKRCLLLKQRIKEAKLPKDPSLIRNN